MYQKIFVAIDDSPTSQKALIEAIDVAKSAGAVLCIAHAADESLLAQHGMGLGSYIDVERTKQAIRDTSQALLDAAAAKALAAGVAAETRLLEASNQRVAELIASGAEAFAADLIVIGTHGRRGFARLLVGSVAENLVRIAHTSLLMVRDH
ncbi:universal stress protein [Dechloromonas sp. HYN0024]|uniref:universal stress protein n=1 Tax=Dechloromonas sp. HYN0024 TaxID=2231055 RepID=UPI000E44ABB9|nr:universal stress protein [Dechloromonas sp. HYN0024]AXS80021.1 universal stress protein [Dechloromonas sp. HYN0024]